MHCQFVLALFVLVGCAQGPDGAFHPALNSAQLQQEFRITTTPEAVASTAARGKRPSFHSSLCTEDRATTIRELQKSFWPLLMRADFPGVWDTLRQIQSLDPSAFKNDVRAGAAR